MNKFKERFAMWLAWRWAKNVLSDLRHVDELTEQAMQSAYRTDQVERALRELSNPLAYEHIGKFHGRKFPWNIAKEALRAGESDAAPKH